MISYKLNKEEKELIASVEEGIPYQTLMTSVLHKFVTGRLIESK